jgi:NAD(P)-dependent dehydrogenase (short-subunit alcohol dehydrogenase family)
MCSLAVFAAIERLPPRIERLLGAEHHRGGTLMGRSDQYSAVITGGTSGIGLATARALAAQGAHTYVAGRDHERGELAAKEISQAGGRATFVRTDVSDDAQVAALAEAATAATGRIDLWFNNAAYDGPIGPLAEFDDATVRQLLDTNIKGVLSGLRHASAHMPAGGVIVNNASFNGTRMPVPIAVVYGATKAAVASMTRSAALDLIDRHIRVYGIAPYIVDTPLLDRLTGGQGLQARREFAARFAPSGQLTDPRDVAATVVDLFAGTAPFAPGDVVLFDAGPSTELLGVP